MTEAQDSTNDNHKDMARSLNHEVWSLLGNTDRTDDDNYRMIHAAHASTYHWLHAGTPLHQQRGEWLISHVYATLGHGDGALRHARRCEALTSAHAELMADFDRAYSLEALARAHALRGEKSEATRLKTLAREAGESIADAEDKKFFTDDFAGGDWHGVD